MDPFPDAAVGDLSATQPGAPSTMLQSRGYTFNGGNFSPGRALAQASTQDVTGVGQYNPSFGQTAQYEDPYAVSPPTAGVYRENPGPVATLFGGLAGLASSFLPNDWHQAITEGVTNVAGVADLPWKMLPAPNLYGDATTGYAKMRGTPEKAQYDAMIAQAPDAVTAEHLKAQYVARHLDDWSMAMGVSPLFQSLVQPQENLMGFAGAVAGNELGLSFMGNALRRTFVSSFQRDVVGSVLKQDPSTLPPELAAMREDFESGGITYEQLLDRIAGSPYAMQSNIDPGPLGLIQQMAFQVVTDPLTYASGGLGVAAKLAESGAVEAAAFGASRILAESDPIAHAAAIAQSASRLVEGGLEPGVAALRAAEPSALGPVIRAAHPDIWSRALTEMPARARVTAQLGQTLRFAETVATRAMNPLGLFGDAMRLPASVADHFGRNLSTGALEGIVRGYGPNRVLDLQNLAESAGARDAFGHRLGTFASNIAMSMEQDSLSRHVLNSQGERIGEHTPTELAQAAVSTGSTLAGDAEKKVRQVMPDYSPGGFAGGDRTKGKAAYEGSISKQRDVATKQLRTLYPDAPAGAIEKYVAKADARDLALVEADYFAHSVEESVPAFNMGKNQAQEALGDAQRAHGEVAPPEGAAATVAPPEAPVPGAAPTPAVEAPVSPELAAAQKALAEAEGNVKMAQRYTLVGRRELTMQDAKALLELLEKSRDPQAVIRAAADRFDIVARLLASNYGKVPEAELVDRMRVALEDLLQGNKLVQTVEDIDKLPLAVHDFVKMQSDRLGEDGYRVGLRPEDQWGIVRDKDGTIIHARAWVDHVAGNETARALGNWDRVRRGLMGEIRTNRVVWEAERRAVEIGVQHYGLTKGESIGLIRALRNKASDMVGIRGLSSEQISTVAHEVIANEQRLANTLGERGAERMLLEAFQGDIRTVGVAPYISGGIKRGGSRLLGTNMVGQIAEALYPQVKYRLNPTFYLQQMVESPFFNILRGKNPVFHPNDMDIRLMDAIDQITDHSASNVDQMELVFLNAKGAAAADIAVGDGTRMARAFEKVKMGSPRDVHAVNRARQFGSDTGRLMRDTWRENYPGEWERAVEHYGTSDPTDIMLRWTADHGLWTESPRARVARMNASLPSDFGARSSILVSDIARAMGHKSGDSMRAAVRDSTLSEREFRQTFDDLKADPGYVDRAWAVANGLSLDEWRQQLEAAYRQAGQTAAEAAKLTRAHLDLIDLLARRENHTLEETLATRFAAGPAFLQSDADLPLNAMTQTVRQAVEKTVDFEGNPLKFLEHTDPQYQRITERMRQLVAEPTDKRKSVVTDAQNPLTKNGRRKADPAPYPADLPTQTFATKDTGTGTVHIGPGSLPEEGPLRDEYYQTFLDKFESNLGSELSTQASEWYPDMPSLFHSIAQSLDPETVRVINREWEKVAKGKGFLQVGAPLADMREELAARLNIAHAATQQSTSPLGGFDYVLRMLDNISRGKRAGSLGLKSIQTQLKRVMVDLDRLRDEGIAQKLYDYIDSNTGRTTRTVSPLDGRQPGAMDIWQKRDFGFMDTAFLSLLAESQVKRGLFKTATAAREDILSRLNLKAEDVKGPGAPTARQYEWMLERMQGLKDHANKSAWLGKSDWTVRDIQAVQWSSIQDSLGLVPGGPGNLSANRAMNFHVTLEASPGSPLANLLPPHDHAIALDGGEGMAHITADVSNVLRQTVAQLTGATILTHRAGWGRTTGEASVAPGTAWHILGTDSQIRDAADTIGYLLQKDDVLGTRASQTRGASGKQLTKSNHLLTGVTPAGNQQVPRHWALDWKPVDQSVVDDGEVMSALSGFMHKNAGPQIEGTPYEQVHGGSDGQRNGAVAPGALGGAFHSNISRAQREHKYGAAVAVKDRSFYSDPSTRLYLAADHRAGVAVTRDGDLVSVFNNKSSEDIQPLLAQAAKQARTLDGFDINGKLPDLYSQHGFRPVARVKWNDEYAPEGWPEYAGRPDVVLMVKDTSGASGLQAVPPEGYAAIKESLPLVDEWDEAARLQAEAVAKVRAYEDSLLTGGHAMAFDPDGDTVLRSVWMPPNKTKGSASTKGSFTMKEFEAGHAVNGVASQALADGTWINHIKGLEDHEPVPVAQVRRLVDVIHSKNEPAGGYAGLPAGGSTWGHQALQNAEAGVDGRGALGQPYLDRLAARKRGRAAAALVARDGERVKGLVEDGWQRHYPDAYAGHRGALARADRGLASPSEGSVDGLETPHAPGTTDLQQGPRGVRGAIAWDERRKAVLHIGATADASTAVHETFHLFAEELDPSAKTALMEEYAKERGLKRVPTVWSRRHEEWAARKFEHYVGGGEAPSADAQAVFNAFGKWAKKAGMDKQVSPELKAVFDQFVKRPDTDVAAHYSLGEQRLIATTRSVLKTSEEQASATHYFRPGRGWLERTVNHPYLGLYPVSWMWGKVLPEMSRFMLRRPFGLKAPLFGLALTNDVLTGMQLQMSTDPQARDFVDKHPEMMRFINMILPGTPWEMPVHLPTLLNQQVTMEQQNAIREAQGKPIQNRSVLSDVKDMITRTVGDATFLGSVDSVAQEWGKHIVDKQALAQDALTRLTGAPAPP